MPIIKKVVMSRNPVDQQTRSLLARILGPHYITDWWMEAGERLALTGVLQLARPQVALEVGSLHGGSLQVMAVCARKVYALEQDAEHCARLRQRFPNVEVIAGPSEQTLPGVLERIGEAGEALGFVLIDGAHDTGSVLTDLTNLLCVRPVCPLFVLMHDSFMPSVRRAIRRAPWADNPHVHALELDFVTGLCHTRRTSPAVAGAMAGGLALAVLDPAPRSSPLVISERNRLVYNWTRLISTAGVRFPLQAWRRLRAKIARARQATIEPPAPAVSPR